jgi:RNA polymerase sigma-70 factor, ECF subfamily
MAKSISLSAEMNSTPVEGPHAVPSTEPSSATNTEPQCEAYVLRAISGDVHAFECLVRQHRARAIRLAGSVLKNPSEAEDVVQEAFLRAWASMSSFRMDCTFYSWISRIVIRLCLNRLRSPFWRRRDLSMLEGGDLCTTAAPSQASDARIVVQQLLQSMSPPLRAALILRELDGLEYEEISFALGIPVGTVKSRLNAARARFISLWTAIQKETDRV